MSKRILASDPVTKKDEVWHTDVDGTVVVESRQDIEPILRENQENRKNRSGFRDGDMHHVAQIPLVVYEELQRQGIADDPQAILKWLEKPENKVFKTHPGRLA